MTRTRTQTTKDIRKLEKKRASRKRQQQLREQRRAQRSLTEGGCCRVQQFTVYRWPTAAANPGWKEIARMSDACVHAAGRHLLFMAEELHLESPRLALVPTGIRPDVEANRQVEVRVEHATSLAPGVTPDDGGWQSADGHLYRVAIYAEASIVQMLQEEIDEHKACCFRGRSYRVLARQTDG